MYTYVHKLIKHQSVVKFVIFLPFTLETKRLINID